MTKEEFLKRLKFDVCVGNLKGYVHNKYGEIILPFDRSEETDIGEKELQYLHNSFIKIGFRSPSYNSWITHKDAAGISINLTSNEVFFYEKDSEDDDNFNKIPDYLIEFMEQFKNEKE